MKPNAGHLPREAEGKRVSVVLRNGQRPAGTWAADGRHGCRWTLLGHPFVHRSVRGIPVTDTPAALPAGEYAIVEVLGHRTIVGRLEEVERFGTKMMSIEPLFAGRLLPAVLIGGSSIYQLTPCTAETAALRQARKDWQLPPSIRAALPPDLLPAPADLDEDDADGFSPSFLDD